jgi:hypothetical protein
MKLQDLKGRKFIRLLIILSIVFTVVVTTLLLVLSPLTKYLIEKYDEKYTGRQITMDWAYVNPFTGYVYFSNLRICESKSDQVFFMAKGMGANVALLKLLFQTYEISELTIDCPRGIIVQNDSLFNFTDLVERFASKKNSDTLEKQVHFNILNVKVKQGVFYFHEKQIPVNYFIKLVDFESPGLRWDTDSIAGKISFSSGAGTGDVKADFMFDIRNLNYRFAAKANKFDMKLIGQYLKELTNYGSFSANFDADVRAKGNLKIKENITASGVMTIYDLHFGKDVKEDYLSFEKLTLAMHEINPENHVYFWDSISLIRPYFKYDRYDSLDNVQTMFGKSGTNLTSANANDKRFNLIIELANYIEVLSRNFFKSDYKVTRLAVYEANLQFNDYTKGEKFSVELNPLFAFADSIDRTHKRVNFSLRSGIVPYGNAYATLSINPRDSSDFDLHYGFQKVSLAMFNPYIIHYTSFPLDRGSLELSGVWNVRNGNVRSMNHMVIIDARVTKRMKNKYAKWIPMPVVLAFLKEWGNVIDYEIPVSGNLKDPKFTFKDVIFDIGENIFIKPLTTRYRMEVRKTEVEIEKTQTVKWGPAATWLSVKQEGFVEKMVSFLEENPHVTIKIYPQDFAVKEKEYIALFEAKKKYYLLCTNRKTASLTNSDSNKIDKMSIKDALFVLYLNRQINDSLVFTIQEKCILLVGLDFINAKFEQLCKDRRATFMSGFKGSGVEGRVKFFASRNITPYNGFSFYKIDYGNEYPKYLAKAYRQMNNLDDEAPRKKLKKTRGRNKEST